MNFFQKLKSHFVKPEPIILARPINGPLGLYIGSGVVTDNSTHIILRGSTIVIPPATGDSVGAIGVIDLGRGDKFQRFYFEDDEKMLQINTSGYAENEICNLIMYNYKSCVGISTEEELLNMIQNVGMPTYSYLGNTYNRTWGENEGMSNFVSLTENVDNGQEKYKVELKSMLYEREIGLEGRTEYLLISIEESEGVSGEIESSVSFAVGVSLFKSEISQF